MKLYDELFFEITLEGSKSELKKMAKFLTSGELDDFFEVTSDYITYDDEFAEKEDADVTNFVFSNDDLGVEIDEFNPEEFLDVFCKAGHALDIRGHLFDVDGEEYTFVSPAGDEDCVNGTTADGFNDELDEIAEGEESDD